MNKDEILHASCRMALAGFLHDIGKFAERAKITVAPQMLEDNKQRYCPHHKKYEKDKGWFSHVHAAYTGMAVDILEKHAPNLVGDNVYPFGSWLTTNVDDSLINAAAAHHKPDTFLQWIIATADRVASGFEREAFEEYNKAEEKNHYQSRQLTLFEQIGKGDENLSYRYALKSLSPASIFPVKAKDCEAKDDKAAQTEYLKLWEEFTTGLKKIPPSHRQQLPLWLDHFDSCWQTYTHAIPSATAFGTKPDVSLYDHSKAVAALAVALWRYHHDRGDDTKQATVNMREHLDWKEEKILLIQGDFFGIQNFIFAEGGDSTKKAAKLLRGRSFYVSLITECAALAVLEALNLPSTSQIINAAGKFLIVAPNTDEAKDALNAIQKKFNDWFLSYSYGQSGLGLAWQTATCEDFVCSKEKQGFKALMDELHKKLERSKYAHFDLCGESPAPAVFEDYLNSFNADFGVCVVNDKAPAAGKNQPSELAQDQINIGTWLVKHKQQRLLITREPLTGLDSLTIPLFGYSIHFTGSEEDSGKFGREVDNGNIRRVFDFSPAVANINQALWNGYARRNISGYVPYFQHVSEWENPKYKNCEIDDEINVFAPKTFNYLACEDLSWDNDKQKWLCIRALAVLKGDIDDLGAMFQSGLEQPTFAKMAALSRQVNNFFAVYLPYLCETKYPNTYIVFAGGDDFFLLGSWKQLMQLAAELRSEFTRYVADNAKIHFSAGLSVTKPKIPIPQLAVLGESALEKAKHYVGKNAVTCFGETVSWHDFDNVFAKPDSATEHLVLLRQQYALSTAYIYGLLRLTDMAADHHKPENALWRSQLYYRTYRFIESNNRKSETNQKKDICLQLVKDIGENGIKKFGGGYRIALHAHLYQHREQT
ncbi:MAG: type III-A CRISPR-associated protein Cas10/Csm1 [Methylococcales bacterium]|nr:type III-A CRISPR-associated protein Cas10/Csm1 [Methylococcales bacterium]